ncbi:hypothetical protein C5B90_13210 [Haloferax sp. Atlit-12N]|uniref:hypothetical protein n=1 Tax=Haloferax sp. Atlit-12N TaxID=2077203 RepID=UPI000E268A43|nr:hypothetical protein [Haloferax sp. Atlit-12N]RDZ64055.1 hypothetical protein C5B90_13210 [Haloferax sp. Atlit-12N]
MKRRNYLKTVGAAGFVPSAIPHADLNSVNYDPIDAGAYIKRYESGTVLSLSVPSGRGDYLTIHGRTDDGDHIIHAPHLDEPNESDDEDDVYHFFEQEPIADYTLTITEDGHTEQVQFTDRVVPYNPSKDFLGDAEYLGEVDLLRLGVSDTSSHLNYDLDTDFDAILWETYDEDEQEWVRHPAHAHAQMNYDLVCPCEKNYIEILGSKRLRAKGIVGDTIEHIPIVRDRINR